MKLNKIFLDKISSKNSQIVELKIVHLNQNNHPLGPIGAMLMGAQHTERVQQAIKYYDGVEATIKLSAKMEIITADEDNRIVFTVKDYNCNKIEIFKPDMSLWWLYYSENSNDSGGDSFPIRDILVDGISYSLQPEI